MPITNKQEEENQPGSDDSASDLEQAGIGIEAESYPTEKEKPGGGINQSPKKRRIFRWAVLLMVIGLAGAGYVYRERLLRLVSKDAAQSAQTTGRKILYWADPMHPAYKSDKPGKAPDCGMDLVPVYAEGVSTARTNLPEGAFQITPEKQQLIGVRYGAAEFKAVGRTLRAVGRLAWDETKVMRVHPRIEGWIEEVFVDFTGKQVVKGQPLISVYSPELWQTQQEYLLALKGRDELANSPFREAVAGSASLLAATRKRLELWDIEMAQLEHLEHAGKPFKALKLHAPSDGFVLNVELAIGYGKQVVVPQEAVMDSGAEQLVFVAHEGGYFEPRRVRLGAKVDDEFIVLGGLKAGERVVTSANFLIDSESKLKSAANGMGMPGMSHGGDHEGRSKAPAASKPSLPSNPADHSQHQPGAPTTPQTGVEDHSRHQPKKQE